MNKIIWVINQFAGTPESGWGERHYYFSQYWKNAGYDVKIISGSYNHMFKKTVDVSGLYKHEVFNGIDFYWIKTPKYNPKSFKRFYSMIIFMIKVLFLPSKVIGKPSDIIVSSMPIFPILSGVLLKRKHNAKLFFEIRDIWPLTLQLLGNKSANHPAVKFIGWFEKFGYRKSNTIVSLLPNAREHIEIVAKKEINFEYIPNGIDEGQLENENLEQEIINKIPKEKFIIGYAGTIGLANALEYLIDATIDLQNKKNIFFVIVGDGYLKSELVEKTKNNNNILFFSKINKNQVQHMLSFFDVCFVGRNDTPLFKHGVSANKYFDYMLAKKPILDSNNYIKDPVELSGGGIIVKPESAEAIKEGILKLHNMSSDERNIIGIKGYNYVKEYHNIEYLSKKYIDIFKKFN